MACRGGDRAVVAAERRARVAADECRGGEAGGAVGAAGIVDGAVQGDGQDEQAIEQPKGDTAPGAGQDLLGRHFLEAENVLVLEDCGTFDCGLQDLQHCRSFGSLNSCE